jgi:2-C-methyl-D-erythritol 4-phosphate cytidylyltransferase
VKATAIIAAGGTGNRFGSSVPKQFVSVLGIPLIVHTLRAFQQAVEVDRIVLVLPQTDLERFAPDVRKRFRLEKIAAVVPGGDSRQASVLSGLRTIAWPTEWVAIHDAARCLITNDLINKTVKACEGWDGAIAAMPIRDTLKKVNDIKIETTESREHLWGMQTPQVFRFPLVKEAYEKAEKEHFSATDDAQVVERFGGRLRVFEGSSQNIKVTYPEDLKMAEVLLRERESTL